MTAAPRAHREGPEPALERAAPPLPHAHAVTWGVAALPHRGPKRELTTERIIDVAIEIADADGLEAVSMGRLAAALGRAPMSLYRYVSGKDDVLLLMLDRASEVSIVLGPGTWRERLAMWIGFVRAVHEAHPWLAELPSAAPTTPGRLALLESGLEALEDLAIAEEDKLDVLLLVLRAISQLARRDAPAVDEAVGKALPLLVSVERFPRLAEVVGSGVYEERLTDSARASDFGLARIIDGVGCWITDRATPDPPPRFPVGMLQDKGVREAVKAVDDARARLRTAESRAADAVERASERLRTHAAKAERKARRRSSEG